MYSFSVFKLKLQFWGHFMACTMKVLKERGNFMLLGDMILVPFYTELQLKNIENVSAFIYLKGFSRTNIDGLSLTYSISDWSWVLTSRTPANSPIHCSNRLTLFHLELLFPRNYTHCYFFILKNCHMNF